MAAYYNERDPYAAEWLRRLQRAGAIAAGDIDCRPIEQVCAGDLAGYAQCHFFAGIGGWSLALRLAGWPDDRPVWTGSCPCQPFSAAGRGRGFSDERHLWPAWFRLIGECRPATIFGEQVDRALVWLDHALTDMEGLGYACAAADLPAACEGAPQNRPRLWFVSDASGVWREGGAGLREGGAQQNWTEPADRSWWNAEPNVARVADGLPGAVGQRRAFGNAIAPHVAASFVRSFVEAKATK